MSAPASQVTRKTNNLLRWPQPYTEKKADDLTWQRIAKFPFAYSATALFTAVIAMLMALLWQCATSLIEVCALAYPGERLCVR